MRRLGRGQAPNKAIPWGILGCLLALEAAGCTTQAFCFDQCESGGTISVETGGTSLSGGAPSVSLSGSGGQEILAGGGTGGVGGGAATTCKDTTSDPNNCGTCGHTCILEGAFAACVDGTCQVKQCASGRVDLNALPTDGCEYACVASSGGEVCDGKDNDCNGAIDEGFDLAHDPNHCGFCGHRCALPQATSSCGQIGGETACVVTTCDAGYYDLNGVAADGCEYACTPTGAEICDDQDNDCDGKFNEDIEGTGLPCDDHCPGGHCVGECTSGRTSCLGTAIVCLPGVEPQLESCDSKDNDCDGTVDNGFDLALDTANCGACGHHCDFAEGVGSCQGGSCKLAACQPGHASVDGSDDNGCEYECPVYPARQESCNGIDDDCNGTADDPSALAAIRPPVSLCQPKAGTPCASAQLLCQGTLGWRCAYGAGVELDETGHLRLVETRCDGLDGNCDGNLDEAFTDLGAACDNGKLGACRDAGKRACDPADPTQTTCDLSPAPNPTATNPAGDPEICNGLDDDCDGSTDEGPSGGLLADLVPVNWGGIKVQVDRYEASRPDASLSSAGILTSHVCTKPNALPWASVTYAQAAAACAASGRRLCTAAELQAACATSASLAYPYGNTYQAASCNGMEHTGSSALPSGSLPQCTTGSNGIFDLSGNLAEWTSTKTGNTGAPQNLDIMTLQGGSFLTPGLALTCSYSLARITVNAVTDSIGFRCCKALP